MRKLVWIVLVLAMIWCGWWWLASVGLKRGLAEGVSALRAEGWTAEMGAVEVKGFPLSLTAEVEGLALSDRTTGRAFGIDRFDLRAPAYWPGNMVLSLPNGPFVLIQPETTFFLYPTDAMARLKLRPGPALELQELQASGAAIEVKTVEGTLLTAAALDAGMVQDAEAPEMYHLTLTAQEFAPGEVLRGVLGVPDDWPRAFEALEAELRLSFDAPLDRGAMRDGLPPPRAVEVRAVDLVWGPLALKAEGLVAIDPAGMPEGTLSVTVENWRQIMDRLEAAELITPQQRAQADLVLNALANLGPDPDTLALQLRFDAGETYLGPIRLGPTMPLFRQ